MIRVAMLSRWHVHANDYARQATANPSIEISAVWDEDATRGQNWASELGVPFYSNLDNLLGQADIEAVIVNTPTNLHREVIVKSAKAGKHVFTEKVLAFTTADCKEIFDAVDASKTKLMLSLPRLSDSVNIYAQQAIKEGLLGDITTVRCRVAHNGAVPTAERPHGWLPDYFFDTKVTGGGAMMDLGAHPIYLTNRVAGPAKAVTARLLSYFGRGADDNSVVVVEYESGAFGIVESGFASGGSPFHLEVYGTEGSLLIEDDTVRIRSSRLGTNGWVTPQLPDRLPMPMEQWVAMINEGQEAMITRDDMYRLTQINEAALESNQRGIRVVL